MTLRRRRRHGAAAALAVAASCGLSPSPVAAQPAATAVHGTATVTAATRGYRVADSAVAERVVEATVDVTARRTRLRLDGSTVRYATPGDTVRGTLPLRARLDLALRPGDTVGVYATTASRPGLLSARQTAALGLAGTSTVDLASLALGTPALGGARVALAFPVGDLVLAARGAVETEPRPGGTSPVYWRGTTFRGGIGLTGTVGDDGELTGALEVTRSTADSLGGRNLFSGGGTVTLQSTATTSVADPFDPLGDARWPLRAALFYARPVGATRTDQPNRLIPQGSLAGGFGSLLVSVASLTVAPSIELLRETSQADLVEQGVRTRITGTGWSAHLGLDVTIPLGSVLELTPQGGYAFGSVGATFTQALATRRLRGLGQSTSFADPIRGGWLALQLSAAF